MIQVQLSDWKSLGRVDLPMQGLVVLMGPNGAGKSNIVEALAVHDPDARALLERDGAPLDPVPMLR